MHKTLIAEQDLKGASDWSIYGLYGLTLASDFSFASHLAPGTGSPDLTFTCVSSDPSCGTQRRAELVYASPPYPDETGESEVFLYRSDDCLIVRFSGICEFYLWPDRILCCPLTSEYRRRLSGYPYDEVEKYHRMLIEIYLLGFVFACWLEWQGIPTLHASAVGVGEGAAAFISSGGGGKSSSAVALMRAGYPLLTDDILPIQYSGEAYVGRPGYPQMRMWPEQAQHFLGHYEDLDLLHPTVSKRRVPIEETGLGTFCEVSKPLACLYLPERRDPADWGTKIKIEPVSRREAVMALIGHSFIPPVVEALGLHPHRLDFFARMALRVPVRRVVFPNGFDYLPRVRRAILADLASFTPISRRS
jgi:hypothetical protein